MHLLTCPAPAAALPIFPLLLLIGSIQRHSTVLCDFRICLFVVFWIAGVGSGVWDYLQTIDIWYRGSFLNISYDFPNYANKRIGLFEAHGHFLSIATPSRPEIQWENRTSIFPNNPANPKIHIFIDSIMMMCPVKADTAICLLPWCLIS